MMKRTFPARLSAALLALVMVLTLLPAAQAAASNCPVCRSSCEMNVIREASCHEEGVYEYLCRNAAGNCPMANKSNLVKGAVLDPNNHADAVYTDNGDGTHTGRCTYHVSHSADAYIGPEKHTVNAAGVCAKCGAVDYSNVEMKLPEQLTIPVALNSTGAKLSVGEVILTLGGQTNITGDYNISYNWYYNNAPVANTAEYVLPDDVTGQEGTYNYILFVSAVPKGSLRQPVSGSCIVTVQVEELLTASATVSTEDGYFFLGDPDAWSGESVSSQIYAAVQDACPRSASPSHVVFHTLPNSTVGSLGVSAQSAYYFEDNGRRNPLDDVKFSVNTGSGSTTGDYTVSFTAYDTEGGSYPGVLTVTVQQYAGNMDVVLTASKGEPAVLSASDFEDFWLKVHPDGVLDSIRFKETPRSTEGSLYVDYVSSAAPGVRVTTKDSFYVDPGRNRYSINAVAFLSGVKQTDYITLDFEAHGTKNNGRAGYLDGTLYIFFHSGGSADITITAAAAGTALSPASFQKAYQAVTGSAGTSFYIQLLDVPAKGGLYVGRTATRQGTLLTPRTVSSYPFSYSDGLGESISSVTYVPAAGTVSESIRYVACTPQGKPMYTGKITFTSSTITTPAGLVLNLTCPATGVKLSAGSFENLPGAMAPKLTMVSFSPLAVSYGALYYGRTDANPGAAITSSNTYFSTVTVNPPAGSLSINDLTFVPAAGVTGVVPVSFTAIDASNNRYTGTLRITVTASPTTPDPTVPSKPAKTFTDVSKTHWSYPYITELTTSGVLNGYDDGTFRPGSPVTMGQALKMIMIAANPGRYGDLEPTSATAHWASGYLEQATADGLLPAGANRDLERSVNRYTIAEIACKAMGLSPVVNAASTPFADMSLAHQSAQYVLPLYNAKIITGSVNKSGQTVFYGVNAITREEFAAIVWRIQSYMQNGYVGAIAVG